MENFRLVATCAFGLEAVVKRELIQLGVSDPKVITPGRIAFAGDWNLVAKTNTWLRCADRILIEVLRFEAKDFDQLFETIKAHNWTDLIGGADAFPVIGRSRNSQLTSVPAVQRTVKKALVESLSRDHAVNELPETGAEDKVEIALLNDEAAVSVDTTGPSLHKRGYRTWVGPAPLKETLAAAMIQLSVWKPQRRLVDPFCGSGTIPIEAALIGRNIAPGINRKFTCSSWPQISNAIWEDVKSHAESVIDNDVELQIIGTDKDEKVLQLARKHAFAAGVENDIHFQQKAFDELRSKHEYGCVICNPPYGERLDEQKRLKGLYQSFPAVLQRLPTWSHFVLTSMPKFEKILQKSATRRRKLFNGRIECMYYQYLGPKPGELDEEKKVGAVFGGLNAKDQEQADLFASRLIKRNRHFRKWPKRGITCYRIYERDIPELPFVVDWYEDCLHITEYERPHDRDPGRHASWLELMKKTASKVLEVPIQRVYFKSRLKTRGGQYEKVESKQKLFEVQENGLTFLVNLSDYVDTGLFLDHRNTRRMVGEQAQGCHFLNLFAYTGSFSVYAADGKAETTTTVDWSNTYLDWARKNMVRNGFDGPEHQFVAADALDFLKSNQQEFDLVVVDPPTYSNRKGREQDWDVQERHVELLELLRGRLLPNATVYFSTNFRRFKLDENALSAYSIREISKQTVPDDFRNKRIHRCWVLKN